MLLTIFLRLKCWYIEISSNDVFTVKLKKKKSVLHFSVLAPFLRKTGQNIPNHWCNWMFTLRIPRTRAIHIVWSYDARLS